MFYYVQQWLYFLQTSDTLIGIPLLGAGAALLLAGWRIWKVAAFVSLALVGGLVGQLASGDDAPNHAFMGAGALLLGGAGVLLPYYAATILGGIIGGCVVSFFFSTLGVVGPVQWVAVALAFVGATAWAYANRTRVVAVITSFEGGVLVVSGGMVLLTQWPFMQAFFNSVARHNGLMVPFLLLVPTVIGVLLQSADAARSCIKQARGS